ncbi:hypothetical protein MKX03_023155, partial [Papaver bracteatum]
MLMLQQLLEVVEIFQLVINCLHLEKRNELEMHEHEVCILKTSWKCHGDHTQPE